MGLKLSTDQRAREWQLITGSSLQDAVTEIWRERNASVNGSHPALEWRYVSLMLRYFGSGAEVLAISDQCVILLQPDGLGRWSTFLPYQACVGAAILSPELDRQAISDSLRSLARKLPSPTTLISLRKQDAAISQLRKEHSSDSFTKSVHCVTTDVDVSGSFEDFWASRSKNLRQSIRRRLQNLERTGICYELRQVTLPAEMRAAVKEHARLELSGWKGRHGTALDGQDRQSLFYVELLENLAQTGHSSVFQLLFDGDVKASLLTIQNAGVLIVNKTAFDESAARLAPGRLLDYLMLQCVFANPEVALIENYTSSDDEDRRWCSTFRDIIDWDYHPSRLTKTVILGRRRLLSWMAKKQVRGEGA